MFIREASPLVQFTNDTRISRGVRGRMTATVRLPIACSQITYHCREMAVGRVGLTQEKLVVAAAELADVEGFEAVTMSARARHFGVRTASLYSHLASTADLREQVAVLALGEL